MILIFLLGFSFSFVGSIPPGTLNLTIIQIGAKNKIIVAWKFALAAALVEYMYAWIAVKFTHWIISSPLLLGNLKVVTGITMLILGGFNLFSGSKPGRISTKFNQSGFRRGLLLSIFNPMGIPFWIGVTTYLQAQKWIDLSVSINLHSYLMGISLGGFSLLMIVAHLGVRMTQSFQRHTWLNKVPGIVLIFLGGYALLNAGNII